MTGAAYTHTQNVQKKRMERPRNINEIERQILQTKKKKKYQQKNKKKYITRKLQWKTEIG